MDQRSIVRPVSKALYLGAYLGGSALGGILFAVAMFAIIGGAAAAENGQIHSGAGAAIAGIGIFIIILAVALLITGAVFLYVLYYKMWAAIQDGCARTTPGKAVGFMFIPIFNIYWTFQAVWGFSKDYNEFLRRHSIDAKPLSEGLFLWACITPFLGFIPFVGWLANIAVLVLYIMVMNASCDAINNLVYAQSRPAVPPVMAPPQEPMPPAEL